MSDCIMKEIRGSVFGAAMVAQPGVRFADQRLVRSLGSASLKPQRAATHHSLRLHDDGANLHTRSQPLRCSF